MKKWRFFAAAVLLILGCTLPVLAGDVPESLLASEDAQIFFAEVTAYRDGADSPEIEIVPVKKIKGDVNLGSTRNAYRPNIVGDFEVEVGGVYLFTYYDENNPTDIFKVTSYDTAELKLKNVEDTMTNTVRENMWGRFERYLNEGRYEEAEHARIDRRNENLPVEGESLSLAELIGVPEEMAETVSIYYSGEMYSIEAETFYRAIRDIMLTDIADVSLTKQEGETFFLPSGMNIMVNGFEGYAFITGDCKVDRHGLHLSSLPSGKYTIKSADRAKIEALFGTDEKLPPLETADSGKAACLAAALIGTAVIVCTGLAVKKIYTKRKGEHS